ncbi:MAG: stage III sporulation protein AB [Clostridia bacterium]|nr:stage III sporulation protein AB [Clostridia bacterium]
MLKGLLLSLVLVACAGAGRVMSNGRKRRSEILGELLAGMRVLRLRMLNSLEPLGILLRKSDARLFRDLGNSLWEGSSLGECWIKLRDEEIKRGRSLDSLTAEDVRLLDDFFSRLGGSGRDEQNELFSQTISSMEEVHSNARRIFIDASRTYTALGALVGVGICIIIV